MKIKSLLFLKHDIARNFQQQTIELISVIFSFFWRTWYWNGGYKVDTIVRQNSKAIFYKVMICYTCPF